MLTEETSPAPVPAPVSTLNDAQREAATYDGGPLIVLAGPGTGKTRVITHRVASMIERGIAPESIVAVTFTVKAARELRERLLDLVGQSAADRLNAHTFHGLGLRLIRRFGDYLGLSPDPTIIDSALVRRLLRSLIREHNLYPELVAVGREGVIAEAMETISTLANHAVFPKEAEAFAAAWLRRLNAGAVGADDQELAAEHERQRRFAQTARLYGLFGEACRQRAWMTFDDLLLWPIRLLREKPPAAAIARDDYRHFVVDEFQDVNLAQIELLRLLCPARESRGGDTPAGPDLCVVGDDDQSIYEFRGADDLAFARCGQTWPGAKIIELSSNYRSEARIIEAANAVMARAEVRFAPEKAVRPCEQTLSREALPGSGIECLTVETDDRCGDVIAAMILSDRARGASADAPDLAPVRPWSSYAVIARTHPELDRIGAALKLEGIPVRLARPPSALEDLAVQDLLRWTELLCAPAPSDQATYATQWLLTRPPFSVSAERLVEWSQGYRAARSRERLRDAGAAAAPAIDATLFDHPSPPSFLDYLLAHHARDEQAGPALARLRETLDDLRQASAHNPADGAVFEIIRRADLAHAELLEGRDRAVRVGRLADIVRFVRARLKALDPPHDLASFWSYYNDLSETDREFRDQGEDRIEGRGEAPEADDSDAVTLLTAHSAKGLEYDTVFVPKVRPGWGYPLTSGPERPSLPDGLIERHGDDRSPKDRALAEERRLFYVACTRARRRLVVMGKKLRSRSKSTDFFNELSLDAPCCSFTARRTDAEVLGEAARLGVKLTSRTALDDTAPGPRADRDEILRRARLEARLGAASALDAVNHPGAAERELDAASDALGLAAQRIALAAHLQHHDEPPAWAADASPPIRAYAQRLADSLRSASPTEPFAAALFRPLPAPLGLSYSWIDEYHTCPRCFYLRRILKVPEPSGAPQLVGQVTHEALAEFYRRRRAAESGDGAAPPTLDHLLQIAREQYRALLPAEAVADPEQLEQVLAQLRLTHQRLDNPADEVEQVEFWIRFPWPRNGQVHTMKAKIDRLDRAAPPGRGHRIVDYKTGHPSKRLREPSKKDLQLAIYAMALRSHQNGGADAATEASLLEPAEGTAEYWLLATGERGTIDLADIAYDEIKDTIDQAIDGMLAGKFHRGKDCGGLCTTFARD